MKWSNIILFIVLLVGIIYLQRKFLPNVEVVTKTHTIFAKHDSLIFVPRSTPYAVEQESDTIEIPIDSAKLVVRYIALHKELFTRKFYSDSAKVDTIGTIKVSYEIFRNNSENFRLSWNLKPATVINTTTVNSVYSSGFFGGLSYNKGLVLEGSYLQKNAYIYKVGYNISDRSLVVGFGVNINKLFKK